MVVTNDWKDVTRYWKDVTIGWKNVTKYWKDVTRGWKDVTREGGMSQKIEKFIKILKGCIKRL